MARIVAVFFPVSLGDVHVPEIPVANETCDMQAGPMEEIEVFRGEDRCPRPCKLGLVHCIQLNEYHVFLTSGCSTPTS